MTKPYYHDYVRHMWRYYCTHHDIKLSERIHPVDLNNWFACNRVYQDMAKAERDVIQVYSTCPSGTENNVMDQYGKQNNYRPGDVWSIIRKTFKRTAIERGLCADTADQKTEA